MPLLTLHRSQDNLYLDEAECAVSGAALRERYADAEPFPHIVIDDFLDVDVLRDIAGHYPSREGKAFFDREQERLKYQFHSGEIGHGPTRNLLAELNSRAFLKFLKELTGIKGLISDPYFEGGAFMKRARAGI